MDTTYRFRFLIYLAAFMLAMSLCFVYAEPLPSQKPLLFQLAPQRAAFLAPSTQEPIFDPAALRAATPVVSPLFLQQLEMHGRYGFFHRAKHAPARPISINEQSACSPLGVAVQSSSAAARTR